MQKQKKTFVQATVPLISEEEAHNLHSLWHCCELGTEFGDIATATATPRQVCDTARASGPSSLTGREGERKKGEKKWMTGRANKAWSGMWGYVPTIVPQTSQERSQNPFRPLNALFWSGPDQLLFLSLFISKLLDPALSLSAEDPHTPGGRCECVNHDSAWRSHIWLALGNNYSHKKNKTNAAMFFGGVQEANDAVQQ